MKILVVRFSSIGDVVLTTPVIRALKTQIPNSEVHFITKTAFKSLVQNNPHIDKVHTIEKSINEVISELKKEKFDFIIDLHKNARTLSLKLKLRCKSYSFPKLNFEKWLLVNLKRNKLPDIHIVDRYFQAVEKLGVKNDHLPCDFFINQEDIVNPIEEFGIKDQFITIAIGAQFATKRMPLNILKGIVEKIPQQVVLIGGSTDVPLAEELIQSIQNKKIVSACGKLTIGQSASIVKQSKLLISNDTGMMHIASCFQTPTVSVWGNTVPELGMYPYFPTHKDRFAIHEVANLKCRPCSKIGFQKCPKGHFNCMNLQNVENIVSDINRLEKL